MMDWETEKHNFTFVTGGDKLTASDSLSDLIGSLRELYNHIQQQPDNRDFPRTIRVVGSQSNTEFEQ
jgi:hypothetical protein